MFAVTGITGQVGGAVARTLLAAGRSVRAVVRDTAKGRAWAERGCEVAVADIRDAAALIAAFQRVEALFILVPPNFDPLPGFPEARAIGDVLKSAIEQSRPGRVVYLSTTGAQATRTNLLSQHTIIEEAIAPVSAPLVILRPAWFMENCSWDVAPAKERGVISSFLQPLDRAISMVASADIGSVAAELLQETWTGRRIVELEGPKRVSPNDVASTFAKLLGKPVRAEIVPRETWESLFRSQGMKNPIPRIQMLNGFNEGWLDFEGGAAQHRIANTTLETVLKKLIATA